MKILNETKLTKNEQTKLIQNDTISKSQKMKTLFESGLDIKTISTLLDVRYNFVYNVISNYIITNDVQVIQETKVNKKSLVLDLYNQGMSNKQIAIELKTNYNYVYKIIKDYKNSTVNTQIV